MNASQTDTHFHPQVHQHSGALHEPINGKHLLSSVSTSSHEGGTSAHHDDVHAHVNRQHSRQYISSVHPSVEADQD